MYTIAAFVAGCALGAWQGDRVRAAFGWVWEKLKAGGRWLSGKVQSR